MVFRAAVKIIVNMLRYCTERIAPKRIELHFLPIIDRNEFEICLLIHKALFPDEPTYLFHMLKPITS